MHYFRTWNSASVFNLTSKSEALSEPTFRMFHAENFCSLLVEHGEVLQLVDNHIFKEVGSVTSPKND